MSYRLLIRLLVVVSVAFTAVNSVRGQANYANISPGKIAIETDISITGANDTFLIRGLRQCLISHLEYLFWKKGWDATVADSNISPGDECSYIAEVSGEIKCHLSETPHISNSLIWPFKNMDISSRLQLTIKDVRDGKAVLETKPAFVTSRDNWLEFAGLTLDKQPKELPNFVFMRQTQELLDNVPSVERTQIKSNHSFDIEIYADSIDPDIETALDYVSYIFYRRFGFKLNVLNTNKIDVKPASLENTEAVFDLIRGRIKSKYGPMRMVIFRASDPEKVYVSDKTVQVGVADVGHRLAVVTALDLPGHDYDGFRAMQIGQLMVHEISHLCGAVDVADDNSIMCGYSNWVCSDEFDPLNEKIITAAILNDGRPGSISDYLSLIAKNLDGGKYSLVDFPQMFFRFQNLNDQHVISRACRAGDFGRALPYAIEGFQDYVLENYDLARDNFYKCLALLGDNGAVNYYLSLTTSGALAEFHAMQSARTGYYPARVEAGAISR